jgi:hypothetical protein
MAAHPTVPAAPFASTQPPPAMHDPAYPPQLGTAGAGGVVDAPPSYEDAQGDEIAPVEGVTRHYSGVTDVNAAEMDDTEPPPFDEAGSADAGRERRETT